LEEQKGVYKKLKSWFTEKKTNPSISSMSLRRSARIAAKNSSMTPPSTPIKGSQKRECPPAPRKASNDEMTKLIHATVHTFTAIRRLLDLVKERGTPDEITANAIVSLTRASWAVEDAFTYKMCEPITQGDQTAIDAIPAFLFLMKRIEEELQKDIVIFQHYRHLPRSIVLASQTIGEMIRNKFVKE